MFVSGVGSRYIYIYMFIGGSLNFGRWLVQLESK